MRYEIEGNNLPVVICHLEEGRKNNNRTGGDGLDDTEYENGNKFEWISEEQSQGLFRANLFFKTFIIHVEVEERV